MANWIRVAAVVDCPPGGSLELVAGDRIVALMNVDGQFHALDGVCPHQGGPLGKGELQGKIVTCPWHGWQFDLKSGDCLSSPGESVDRYEVRIDGDDIQVKV